MNRHTLLIIFFKLFKQVHFTVMTIGWTKITLFKSSFMMCVCVHFINLGLRFLVDLLYMSSSALLAFSFPHVLASPLHSILYVSHWFLRQDSVSVFWLVCSSKKQMKGKILRGRTHLYRERQRHPNICLLYTSRCV